MDKMRILLICVILGGTFFRFSNCQLLPDERCINDGDLVCSDCFSVGTCVEDSTTQSGFNVIETMQCPSEAYCDMSIEEGECVPLNPTLTDCGCSSGSCHIDPNNPNKYLNCAETPDQSTGPCLGDILLFTCSCSSDSTSTKWSTSTSTSTTISNRGTDPQDRCNAQNDVVCTDCFGVGTCAPDPRGGFIVVVSERCTSGAFCDRTIADGECVPLNPAVTDCGCVRNYCQIDPNDSTNFMDCEREPNHSQSCNGTVNLVTCTCDAPFTGTYSTYPITTKSTTITKSPTPTEYVTLTSTESSSALDCPSCDLIPDDDPDDCNGYYNCNTSNHANCPGNACFDPDTCRCLIS